VGGDDGRKLFQCGAQRARIQGSRCNEPVRPIYGLVWDDSFYDDSLLRRLSSRIEHSRIVVPHCRNSSVLSLLSALLALFRCASVFFFFYFSTVLFSWLWFFHAMTSIKKERKEEKINTVDLTFFLDAFWTTAWAFFNKSDLIDIFLNYLCNFLYT
jgi:hypothetical protein